ncbi:MAG: hypothetical protein QM765_44355 [Myxococcales bacterium]
MNLHPTTAVGLLASVALLGSCAQRSATNLDAGVSGPTETSVVPAPPKAPAGELLEPSAPGHEWKLLEPLDARIELPAGCSVDDTTSEGRPPSFSLYDSTGVFSLMVRVARPEEPATLDAARASVGTGKILREEKNEDGGWLLQWQGSASEFGLDSLRRVAGVPVRCFRTLRAREASDAAARACLSLSPRQ